MPATGRQRTGKGSLRLPGIAKRTLWIPRYRGDPGADCQDTVANRHQWFGIGLSYVRAAGLYRNRAAYLDTSISPKTPSKICETTALVRQLRVEAPRSCAKPTYGITHRDSGCSL